jgi:hypothetical protein
MPLAVRTGRHRRVTGSPGGWQASPVVLRPRHCQRRLHGGQELVVGVVFARPCSEAEACAVVLRLPVRGSGSLRGEGLPAGAPPAWDGVQCTFVQVLSMKAGRSGSAPEALRRGGRRKRQVLSAVAPRLIHAARRRLSSLLGIPRGIWDEVSVRLSRLGLCRRPHAVHLGRRRARVRLHGGHDRAPGG